MARDEIYDTKYIHIILGIFFVLFFIYVIYAADQSTLPFFIRRLYKFPGGDKIGHIVLLGTLSFFVNLFLYPKRFHFLGKSIKLGSLIVFLLITIEEFSQILMPSRTFDFIDLFCSYVGIFLGDTGVKFFKNFTSSQTD